MKNHAEIGLKNEIEIITYLNGKKFQDLNRKWKGHIKAMFPFVIDNDIIYASKFPDSHAKPDAIVKVRHTISYLSIKSGKNPSIHMEEFFTFKRFLKKLDISDRIIRIIYFYHFGESNKLNNEGKPFTKEEMMEKYADYFLEANEYLDRKAVIEKIVDRCVIKGANYKRTGITHLYYGSLEEGFLLSKEEIYNKVLAYRSHEDRPLHFGALNYQPAGRSRNAKDYRYIRIKWPALSIMFYEGKDVDLDSYVNGK